MERDWWYSYLSYSLNWANHHVGGSNTSASPAAGGPSNQNYMALLNTSQSYYIRHEKRWNTIVGRFGRSFHDKIHEKVSGVSGSRSFRSFSYLLFFEMQLRTSSYKVQVQNSSRASRKRRNNMQRRCLIFGKSTQSESLLTNRNVAKDENKWESTSSVMGLWKQTRKSTDITRFPCNNKKNTNAIWIQTNLNFCVWH